jgi:hypothetical protein
MRETRTNMDIKVIAYVYSENKVYVRNQCYSPADFHDSFEVYPEPLNLDQLWHKNLK